MLTLICITTLGIQATVPSAIAVAEIVGNSDIIPIEKLENVEPVISTETDLTILKVGDVVVIDLVGMNLESGNFKYPVENLTQIGKSSFNAQFKIEKAGSSTISFEGIDGKGSNEITITVPMIEEKTAENPVKSVTDEIISIPKKLTEDTTIDVTPKSSKGLDGIGKTFTGPLTSPMYLESDSVTFHNEFINENVIQFGGRYNNSINISTIAKN